MQFIIRFLQEAMAKRVGTEIEELAADVFLLSQAGFLVDTVADVAGGSTLAVEQAA